MAHWREGGGRRKKGEGLRWPGAVKLLKREGRQVSDKRLCDWYWYLKMWVSVLGAVTLFLAPNSSLGCCSLCLVVVVVFFPVTE